MRGPEWQVPVPVEIIKCKFSLSLFPKEMDQEGGVNCDAVISSLQTIREENRGELAANQLVTM